MIPFIVGQRWMSQTEPELGLGIIVAVESKNIEVLFRASEQERRYGIRTAPLKRVQFDVGDVIKNHEGDSLKVETIAEDDGLFIYGGEGKSFPEIFLNDSLSFNKPEEKLFNGMIDSAKLFQLRLDTINARKNYFENPLRGLLGGRISLIPHQFYLANEVSKRPLPRVLLADEVGLGKTIEAGLILHQLYKKGRVERVLVLTPDSLVFQWFIEMHRKFSLSMSVVNQEVYLEEGSNPFVDNELVVASIGLLKGSEVARNLLDQAEWDLVIVDEAHQVKWTTEEESLEYKVLKKLAAKSPGLLLLTATPEQLGPQGHFGRLKLLDPDRFHSYSEYVNEGRSFKQLADVARKIYTNESLNDDETKYLRDTCTEEEFGEYAANPTPAFARKLIDRHGTGRVFFRNTRKAMSGEYDFFPKRVLHSYPLEKCKKGETPEEHDTLGPHFKAHAAWLIEFLLKMEKHKILLICHSKKKILSLEKTLKEAIPNIKLGLFHSGLSLMARDRQAAYFSEPGGAQVLLCTEIGSEGRNFEFASHLVLFDLPRKPDLLEQRIGRLDRIGQKGDVNIHVPFVSESWEQILHDWYHQGVSAFENTVPAAMAVYSHVHEELHTALMDEDFDKGSELIKRSAIEVAKIGKEIEQSRDFLIELNSFVPEVAHKIIKDVKEIDASYDLSVYMDKVFDEFGVDVEELDGGESTFIRPSDNMFIPYFPGLPADGMSFTYKRYKAREREEFSFMTWDHPMVIGSMELISSGNFGNVTIATRKDAKNKKSFVETFFVLEAIGPKKIEPQRFFPPTLIRVLIDKDGEDFAEKWSKEVLDSKLTEATSDVINSAKKLPKALIKGLLEKAGERALEKSNPIVHEYMNEMRNHFNYELERLEELQKQNPTIRPEEFAVLKERKESLELIFGAPSLTLDSFRLIL